jgi:hypothetical protein
LKTAASRKHTFVSHHHTDTLRREKRRGGKGRDGRGKREEREKKETEGRFKV